MEEIIQVTWTNYPGKGRVTEPFGLLEKEVIERTVPDGIMPGNYRIGRLVGTSFHIIYVGRVDDRQDRGLKDRLIEHIGEWQGTLYFNWNNEANVEDAYYRECEDYHKWLGYEGALENDIHPRKPDEMSDLNCPICDQ